MFRLVLADPQTGYRQLLRRYLEEALRPAPVVAETRVCGEVFSLCQLCEANLLILDPEIANGGLAELISAIRGQLPHLQILLHARAATPALLAALSAGAHGCVTKEECLEELLTGVRLVGAGGSYFSPGTPAVEAAAHRSLTPRQRQLIALIAAGHSTKEVAEILKISFKTADHHRTRLMKKLRVHDLPALVRFAIRNGLASI